MNSNKRVLQESCAWYHLVLLSSKTDKEQNMPQEEISLQLWLQFSFTVMIPLHNPEGKKLLIECWIQIGSLIWGSLLRPVFLRLWHR